MEIACQILRSESGKRARFLGFVGNHNIILDNDAVLRLLLKKSYAAKGVCQVIGGVAASQLGQQNESHQGQSSLR